MKSHYLLNLKVLVKQFGSAFFKLPVLTGAKWYRHGVCPGFDSLVSFLPALRGMMLTAGKDALEAVTLVTSDVYYELLRTDTELSDKVFQWYVSYISNLVCGNVFDVACELNSVYNRYGVVRRL